MTSFPTGDPLLELRYALADADAEDPPSRVAERVKLRSLAARRPGGRLESPERISASAVFSRAIDALHELLETATGEAWHRHALRDLDVQGLIGHLIGVEGDFQASLQGSSDAASMANHVEATQQRALAQRGRAPSDTYREWRLLARQSVELLEHHAMSDVISLHGLTMPLDSLLIIRAFELWTHTEDIDRALERELRPPDPESLQRMVDLAVELLPRVFKNATPAGDPATVRLVLIGDAGGTFDVPLVAGRPGPICAQVVADAIEFCRLVANRLPASEVALSLSGDVEFAEALLVGAATLALD